MRICWSQYLQVHLCKADQHPGNEALPKPSRNKAHLEKALQGIVGLLTKAVDVHGGLGGKEVGQKIATAKGKKKRRKDLKLENV